MISRATANWTAMKNGGRGPWVRNSAKMGKLNAAMMEASETRRVMSKTRAKTAMAARAAQGAETRKTPKPVATPDGEDVAENGKEGGEGLCFAVWECGGEVSGDEGAEPDGAGAFEHVEEEGDGAEGFAAVSEDVGGADVAAAYGADILPAEDTDQQVADGDGA